MNSVVIIGRTTRDVELRYTQSGKAVATMNVAVNRPFEKDKADFFKVVVWNKPAENAAKYLAKGRLVGIQGRLQNNVYEDKNGEKRYATEIIAENVEYLESSRKQSESEGFQAIDEDSDIPF